jgi:lysophospholipase L1-like esterase
MVGGNDLYVNKCNDQFVMANVMNVAKRIFEDQPDAKIVLHGIIPRKDDLDAKSNDLGHAWNRAQGINLDVRKFIKTHSSRIFYMNFGQTLMVNGGMKGRKSVDPSLISGIYPTPKGMQKWGDLAVKKLAPILKGFDMTEHRKKTKKPES